jgi:DNA-binding XRE family transcriptional regulator
MARRLPPPRRSGGPTISPFFCLARGAWIRCAVTWDASSGEFCSVEGPRGFASYREAVEASRFLGGMTGSLPISNMAPMDRVAMKIKSLRAKRGLTQKQLAERAGISHGYLARLETARQDPSLTILEKLAKALKVKTAELLG